MSRKLARRHPEREKRESIRHISAERLRVSFSISEDLNLKLQSLRDLLSHIDANLSIGELLDHLADLGLNKYDPTRRATAAARRRARHDKKYAVKAEMAKDFNQLASPRRRR